MDKYVIYCIDFPESTALRVRTRPDHLNFLKDQDCVLVAGPFLDSEGSMNGSMLIIQAASLDDAQAFADEDPYAKAGLFQKTIVRAWRQTAGSFSLDS